MGAHFSHAGFWLSRNRRRIASWRGWLGPRTEVREENTWPSKPHRMGSGPAEAHDFGVESSRSRPASHQAGGRTPRCQRFARSDGGAQGRPGQRCRGLRGEPDRCHLPLGMYPIIGLVLARLAFGYDMLPLLFPLASASFALVGPLAAIGLYEMSWRREQGFEVSWTDAFGVLVRARSARSCCSGWCSWPSSCSGWSSRQRSTR